MDFLKRHWEMPLFAVFAVFAVYFSQFDIWVSQLFWQPDNGFYLNDNPLVKFSFVVFRYMPHVIVPLLLVLLALSWLKASFKPSRKYTAFLFWVLIIGPGLIIHPILKDNWDRPRPRDIQQFDGKLAFSPAFVMVEREGKNQSFASGHSGMGFFFMAFAWVFRKRRYLLVGLLIGSLVSLGRIVQGGHFLTDTITSAFIVYFTCQVLAHFLLGSSRIRSER